MTDRRKSFTAEFKTKVALEAIKGHRTVSEYKETTIHRESFFSNITIQSFRSWNVTQPMQGVPRFPKQDAIAKKLEIIGDFNDRHAYHEGAGYFSNPEVATRIIDLGLEQMAQAIEKSKELVRERNSLPHSTCGFIRRGHDLLFDQRVSRFLIPCRWSAAFGGKQHSHRHNFLQGTQSAR
jgi:hypothetical protein